MKERKAAVISFTRAGMQTASLVSGILKNQGWETFAAVKSRYIKEGDRELPEDTEVLNGPLSQWAREVFPVCDGVIFVGAAGIAVRTVAPFVKDKRTDPAVLVLDEKGNFVIPLLSGHIGGANEMALLLSEELKKKGRRAVPVITTATDVNGRFAVDVFAARNSLWISDMKLAKEVSARLLNQEEIPLSADPEGERCLEEWNRQGRIPRGLHFVKGESRAEEVPRASLWIHIGVQKDRELPADTLYLVPRTAVLGIGCRRGILESSIEEHVRACLEQAGIFWEALEEIATIDLKKEEPGLLAAAENWHLPVRCFTAEELKQAPGSYTASAFVSQVTGTDNVCERSAVLAAAKGRLIMKKNGKNGVTAACAVRNWRVEFE